jgi:acyl-coenzyme A thioesterase 13
MNVPDNFQLLFRTSPAIDLIGPIHCKGSGKDLFSVLGVETKHSNARGIVHGGILATLADVAVGYTMVFQRHTAGPGNHQSQPRLRRKRESR